MRNHPAQTRKPGRERGHSGHRRLQYHPETPDAALTLQRQLLPAGLPVLPAVRLAAAYLPGQDRHRAGGDWFDAIPLPDGSTALAVGDVAGHGAAAATAMAQLRAVLRAAILAGEEPAVALGTLDTFASHAPETRGASACVVALDPATGTARYSCAGHPRPLVCAPDGAARFLDGVAGGPLGIGAAAPAGSVATVEPGAVLLLYSDGLITTPGQQPKAWLRGLCELASAAVGSARPDLDEDAAERVCSIVLGRLDAAGQPDDVTVIAAHRLSVPRQGWSVTLPAEPGELPGLRRGLAAWLQGLGVSSTDMIDVELAVYEAAANAVIHGRPRLGPATVTVAADLDGRGGVRISVSDRGNWLPDNLPPRAATRRGGGRGLALIRTLTDAMEIATSPAGTTVTLGRRVSHPVLLSQPGSPPASRPKAELRTSASSGSPAILAVRGPVDGGTIDKLIAEIMRASAGGRRPVTVDLSGATFLSADGFRDLRDLASPPGASPHGASPHGAEEPAAGWLRLLAAPGSIARHVLELAGLDGELAA